MIYLDNNATTAVDPQVIDAMMSCFARGPMNASSQHGLGRTARKILDDAISEIGCLLGADVDSPGGDQLVLTSGGSESNNLALAGLGEADAPLVVSSIEHPSVLAVASAMRDSARDVRVIGTRANGTIDLDQAADVLHRSPKPGLASVMSANNETGVIQPITELAKICKSANVLLHVDATQTVGKLPLRFSDAEANVAAITFTAHKFHGPAGIGGLLLRSGVSLRASMLGGEQQFGRRPGTEAVPLVVGMAMALRLAHQTMTTSMAVIERHRDRFEQQLSSQIEDVVFHGRDAATLRLPGTSCFSIPRTDRQSMLMALDLAGIACSSGSACASGSSRPSHVLTAMGVSNSQIEAALRIGLSRFTTDEDICQAIEAITRTCQRLRRFQAVENLR